MRISVSNLAWDVAEDPRIAELLTEERIDAIDVAPGKYFPEIATAPAARIHQVRQWWSDRGIGITGMQALLFGAAGLNVFGDETSQSRMLDHLDGVCRIGAELEATRLVFGSPKNRDRGSLPDEQAHVIAVDFFRRLGDVALRRGVLICIEPNPPRYGCNFVTTSDEAGRLVQAVAHPAIRMHLDTGAMTINREDPARIVSSWHSVIAHVHASEPDLVPLGDGATDHRAIAAVVGEHLSERVVAIEMLATPNEAHRDSIRRAARTAKQAYGRVPAGEAANP